MRFFFPDSQDQIHPGFDFQAESWPIHRVRQRDDLYAHEVFDESPYDGVLVSKSIVDGDGRGASGRYTLAQRHRLYRVGVRRFFRLDRPDGRRLSSMGDCGAFSYIDEEEPPYSVDDVIDFYEEAGFDAGVSVDHIVAGYDDSPGQRSLPGVDDQRQEWARRQEMTLDLAAEFLRRHKVRGCRFEPIGAVQGWSPDSFAAAATKLEKMGYRRIGLGGLVPISRFPDKILECVQAVKGVKKPGTDVHLFGITVLDQLGDFQRAGVESFDSTSPFRQAFKDDKNNYHTPSGENFVAIRIPQTDSNPKLKNLIREGRVDQGEARRFEAECLALLRSFEEGTAGLEETVEAIDQFQRLAGAKRSFLDQYKRTLERRPWRDCICSVCRAIGIEVILFRGTERNKRRGFHNLWVFQRALHSKTELMASATASS